MAAITPPGPVDSGQPIVLTMDFFADESLSNAVEATDVQLDITFDDDIIIGGTEAAGPFLYSLGQITNPSTGVYQYTWTVPFGLTEGIYIANWTVTYGADQFFGAESFAVNISQAEIESTASAAPSEFGIWAGSFSYAPLYGNAITINFAQLDYNGTAWQLNSFVGNSATAGSVIQRAGDTGGIATPQFPAPFVGTIVLTALAETQAARDQARSDLSQAMAYGIYGESDLTTFVYNEPTPKQMFIRRSGSITESKPDLGSVQFTIGMTAPDPRQYSLGLNTLSVLAAAGSGGLAPPWTPPILIPAASPAGSISVTNTGNYETRPTITINGPINSPALLNVTTSQSASWSTLNLGASDTLTVDFLNRVAYLNGAFRPEDPSSMWWTLWPGENTVQLQGSSGTGAQMTVNWYHAWLNSY